MVKAIVFDLDGTLIESHQDVFNTLIYTLNQFNLPLMTIEQVIPFIGPGIEELITHCIQGTNVEFKAFRDCFK